MYYLNKFVNQLNKIKNKKFFIIIINIFIKMLNIKE